ncbi:MAG: hypothetical protein ABH967_00945 [Patescibacteria group bacterium]
MIKLEVVNKIKSKKRQNYEYWAKVWLKLLRTGDVINYKFGVECLRNNVKEGGLKISDIGTNEAELKSFEQKVAQ